MTNIHSIHPLDKTRSTVGEEIDAMDWEFSNLARLLTELETQPDESTRTFIAKEARRRLDRLVQRAYRAKQITCGLKVTKTS
ncbi:hypothetical protein [Pseudomonas sp. UMAB-40]|uniref:hypothetical protein n=1 Tax=Pseudomonas sp. UMAB-40 TaxID=1365407 RepID=UPI001C58C549|nr:hypothetical protein [Pseudomonas sp. UMAB-40]